MTQAALFDLEQHLRPAPSGIRHVFTPDMSTLCRADYLDVKGAGDTVAVTIGPRWKELTCKWCRSLGRDYYRKVCAVMTGHDTW